MVTENKYLYVNRDVINNENLSVGARYLYIVLLELETRFKQEYDTAKEDYVIDKPDFYCSDKELATESDMSIATVRKYKRELKEAGVIRVRIGKWVNKRTREKSIVGYSAYILKH